MARVTIEQLGKRFGGETVIDHVSLDVKEGEFVTLLGPSGCGKTTTLRIVAGFLSPDTGCVCFNGADVTRVPTQKRRLGMVFQDYALFPHLNVADNVGFALRASGTPKADIGRRVRDLLALIRLPSVGDRFPAELSGGQQQRIAIARALAHTPAVLLMDEPLGALDLKLREAMQNELHAIQRQLGITTIYVTHDQEEALSLSDRIALMRRGKIEQLGTPKEIYGRPATPFSAFFLGKINFLAGKLQNVYKNTYVVATERGIVRAPVRPDAAFTVGDEVLIAVRPEHLRIANPGARGDVSSDLVNSLKGRVLRQKFIGKVLQFEVEVTEGRTFVIDGSVDWVSEPGSAIEVTWNVAATNLYPFAIDPEIGVDEVRTPQGDPAVRASTGEGRIVPAARATA
ncbi:ABC transporter ATP-binding protein [Methylobacterium sp. NEAU 140]|uniref:ABC transporter ATP-binding protein n=1 Tax=Methylobacterium sp. NEAU 140 TaxID=3064945 RepID=UPI002735229C|nr:ABC transporter ATP-binding protein [Methylobacterium sp. NEAU 140]MDP4026585.1 ABC transporter ATP-binding protein [Methylobacterium sp. NEAU 140]